MEYHAIIGDARFAPCDDQLKWSQSAMAITESYFRSRGYPDLPVGAFSVTPHTEHSGVFSNHPGGGGGGSDFFYTQCAQLLDEAAKATGVVLVRNNSNFECRVDSLYLLPANPN